MDHRIKMEDLIEIRLATEMILIIEKTLEDLRVFHRMTEDVPRPLTILNQVMIDGHLHPHLMIEHLGVITINQENSLTEDLHPLIEVVSIVGLHLETIMKVSRMAIDHHHPPIIEDHHLHLKKDHLMTDLLHTIMGHHILKTEARERVHLTMMIDIMI